MTRLQLQALTPAHCDELEALISAEAVSGERYSAENSRTWASEV